MKKSNYKFWRFVIIIVFCMIFLVSIFFKSTFSVRYRLQRQNFEFINPNILQQKSVPDCMNYNYRIILNCTVKEYRWFGDDFNVEYQICANNFTISNYINDSCRITIKQIHMIEWNLPLTVSI